MAVKKKFTQPLQVVETEETRDRITAIAEAEEISQAQVIRELIHAGLEDREALCATRTGLSVFA
jgi:predicted DNA-binding protein